MEGNELATTGGGAVSLAKEVMERGLDAQQMEQILDVGRRQEEWQARREYVKAMTMAKQELPSLVVKGAVVNHKGASYNYATLASIVDSASSIMAKHGFTWRWETDQDSEPGVIRVACVLSHFGGHEERVAMKSKLDTSGSKNPVQQVGSTVTYLERYTLKAALGISEVEDDSDGQPRRGEPQKAKGDEPTEPQMARLLSLAGDPRLTKPQQEWVKARLPFIEKGQYSTAEINGVILKCKTIICKRDGVELKDYVPHEELSRDDNDPGEPPMEQQDLPEREPGEEG